MGRRHALSKHLPHLAICLAAVMLACCAAAARCDDGFMPIAEAKSLSFGETDRGRPVRIKGVVTLIWRTEENPSRTHLVVQDETEGIWINAGDTFTGDLGGESDQNLGSIAVGCEVEIDGVTSRGGFATTITPRRIRSVGKKPLPEPLLIEDADFFLGAIDGRRVVVSGVVQGVQKASDGGWLLVMERASRRFVAKVPRDAWEGSPDDLPGALVDATVRLTGVLLSAFNTRGQYLYSRVHAVARDDLVILSPPPSTPFESPYVPLDAIAQFSFKPLGGHRLRTEGTVIHGVSGRFLQVQEGSIGVHVGTQSREAFRPGDRVEIAGFIDRSHNYARLSEAVARVISHGPAPDPRRLSPAEIIEISRRALRTGQMAKPGDFDGCLIRFPARLLDVEKTTEGTLLSLECEGTNVVAQITNDEFIRLPKLAPGCELDVTGVLEVELNRPSAARVEHYDIWDLYTIDRLSLRLRSADDVQVLKAAAWWTAGRLAVALAGLAALLLGSLAWIGLLRRQVAAQSARLAGEMQKRRDAAVEFQASLRERNRLAANLHDTLLQSLAGAGFQLDTCRRAVVRQDLADTSEHLDVARRMLKHAVGELRGSVWALRTMPMAGQSFSAAVAALVAHLGSGHAAKITVSSNGEPFEIPNFVVGNLLLVAQEAIRNALHHGQPKTIHLQIDYDAAAREVTMTVADDGSGFAVGAEVGPAQGHFGVQGMRERIASLGGTLTIDSRPGQGTRVTAVVVTPAYDTQLEESAEEGGKPDTHAYKPGA